MLDRKEIRLLKSALTEENPFIPTTEVNAWLSAQRERIKVTVEQIPFRELKDWAFEPHTGNLRHASGRFFSIEGLEVRTNWGAQAHWTQPIINQAEIGILGIIAKEFNGILYFLMQAKVEPGNINFV
jgi:oxidase EvaA